MLLSNSSTETKLVTVDVHHCLVVVRLIYCRTNSKRRELWWAKVSITSGISLCKYNRRNDFPLWGQRFSPFLTWQRAICVWITGDRFVSPTIARYDVLGWFQCAAMLKMGKLLAPKRRIVPSRLKPDLSPISFFLSLFFFCDGDGGGHRPPR